MTSYKWGPYLSERQWGTVREDYSGGGTAWDYFPHDHARSRAYRWGEDGLAGICDEQQRLCVALALWNGNDPILKERLFGLTNGEGNHGEDVKEHYYYLDATPSHSYLRMLYKYPHAAFPYTRLAEENRRRGVDEPEFELVDTGIFDGGRYFDVEVEYGKASDEDLAMRVTVTNRGPEPATAHLVPTIWFRNTWSWQPGAPRPQLTRAGERALTADHPTLGRHTITFDAGGELVFCENETNARRHWGAAGAGPYKDGIGERILHGHAGAVRQDGGTKAGIWYVRTLAAGASATIHVRLRAGDAGPIDEAPAIVDGRRADADAYWDDLSAGATRGERDVLRQAIAGMIWSKQFYHYDVRDWLAGDPAQPPPPAGRTHGRNREWEHLNNADVLSMPDAWEYPWYAAWDLAFHCVPLALVDTTFAKQQLVLLTREWYMHPNGQLPAYEWAFGDVNPPVHAWATWKVYELDRQRTGVADTAFLERVFHKLMLNFTWWVNRKDAEGRNIFQGGFLGLDNIGVFDRSAPLPTGGHIDQADGTSWMAMYALNLMRIALELAQTNPVYEDIATKFFEHFLHIAEAMANLSGDGAGLWDEQDGFFYDALHLPDGKSMPLKVRSMVGLIPLFAVEVLEPELLARVPGFAERLRWFLDYRPDLASLVSRWDQPGGGERRLLSLLRGSRMKKLLRRALDEAEFLSAYGIRALSRHHADHPYVFWLGHHPMEVRYQPAESTSNLFGGNSNWRGPIWFPVNYLLIDSLRQFHRYYGEDFKVEHPTGSGRMRTLAEIADDLGDRLISLFLPDANGKRPFLGQYPQLQEDPGFKDLLLFHEYFHGDTGRGVGASHQTGWTGLVASLIAEKRGLGKQEDL